MSTVNILGTKYTVVKKKYKDEPEFEKQSIDGYCDFLEKKIVYCDMTTYPSWEDESNGRAIISEKQTIRHEIVHAFFDESGLCTSAVTFDGAWPKNEEMVDWIAIQGPKIYKAWQEADAV